MSRCQEREILLSWVWARRFFFFLEIGRCRAKARSLQGCGLGGSPKSTSSSLTALDQSWPEKPDTKRKRKTNKGNRTTEVRIETRKADKLLAKTIGATPRANHHRSLSATQECRDPNCTTRTTWVGMDLSNRSLKKNIQPATLPPLTQANKTIATMHLTSLSLLCLRHHLPCDAQRGQAALSQTEH